MGEPDDTNAAIKWEEVGRLGHIYIFLPESQGDASTDIKETILLLQDLGNGAAN